MTEELPKTIQELETPCLLVDIDKVKRNCQRMIDRCQEMGLELRPHMKTNKTIEGGILMTNGTKRKIVVSTIDEAIFFSNNGFDDIVLGTPILKERISKRLINLVNKVGECHVLVESLQGINGLLATPLDEGKQWSMFLEVDCGNGRTGCLWNSETAIEIVKAADTASNVKFQGLYTHCGNSYSPYAEVRQRVQQETTERLISLTNRLSNEGIDCKIVGCGSTPSCSKPADSMSNLTEMHPGNYIFYDYTQVLSNSCTFDDVACKVATTIVSHKPEVQTMVVDCGWNAFGLDAPDEKWPQAVLGKAPVDGHPELVMFSMTQELGKLKAASGEIDYSKYPIGSRLYLYPWHSCCTAALHPVYYIHSGDKIVGTWKPTRGW